MHLEESDERARVRTAFDIARTTYRAALDASTQDALTSDESLRELLRSLLRAADDAVAAGVQFGADAKLDLARESLSAAERAAALAQVAAQAMREAERARDAEAEVRAAEAIRAAEEAQAARAAADRLHVEYAAAVEPEPEPETAGGATSAETLRLRVRTPMGTTLERRFVSTATLRAVRAWIATEYPTDAPTPLTPTFALKTQPLPGVPSIVLDGAQEARTLLEVGLQRDSTLIIDMDHSSDSCGAVDVA